MRDHGQVHTLADLVSPYLAEQCLVILEGEGQLRAGEPVVHPTRVAVRRLRSTLRTFGELVEPADAAGLEEELVWLAGLLGGVRDLDVLGTRLADRVAALPVELVIGPVANQITIEISLQRKDRWADLMAGLESDRYQQLADSLEQWRTAPAFAPAAGSPAMAVKGYLKQSNRRLKKRLAAALAAYEAGQPEADDLLHRARKSAKRHRYAVELAQPALGSRATKMVAKRKELQDLLGEFQDSFVSASFLRDLGARYGRRAGHNGFTYGLLYGGEVSGREQVLKRLGPLIR